MAEPVAPKFIGLRGSPPNELELMVGIEGGELRLYRLNKDQVIRLAAESMQMIYRWPK